MDGRERTGPPCPHQGRSSGSSGKPCAEDRVAFEGPRAAQGLDWWRARLYLASAGPANRSPAQASVLQAELRSGHLPVQASSSTSRSARYSASLIWNSGASCWFPRSGHTPQLHVHYACFLPDSLTCQSCFRLALDPRCHIVSAWKLLKRLLGRWAFLQGRHADAYAQTLPDVDRGARWVDGYCYRESETPTGISRAAGRRPKTPADGQFRHMCGLRWGNEVSPAAPKHAVK